MYKFNGGAGAKICDGCRVIIEEPFPAPITNKEDFCDLCQKVQDFSNKFMEEHKELMEDLVKKGD